MVMAIGVMAPTRALTRVATVVTRPARRSSLKPGINAATPVKSRTRAPWISPTMNEITIRTPRQRHQLSLVRFQLLPSACTGPAPSAKSAGNETAQRTRTQITTGIVTIKTEPAITHPQRNLLQIAEWIGTVRSRYQGQQQVREDDDQRNATDDGEFAPIELEALVEEFRQGQRPETNGNAGGRHLAIMRERSPSCPAVKKTGSVRARAAAAAATATRGGGARRVATSDDRECGKHRPGVGALALRANLAFVTAGVAAEDIERVAAGQTGELVDRHDHIVRM